MTEEQYTFRRAAIMARIYVHEDAYSDGRPKYPKCLRADMKELEELDREWREENEKQ